MNLDEAQKAMLERSAIARAKQNAENARGSKKKKGLRPRASISSQLISLALDPKVPGKVRAWAIQQQILMKGKPICPFEMSGKEDERVETTPTVRGSDLFPARIPEID